MPPSGRERLAAAPDLADLARRAERDGDRSVAPRRRRPRTSSACGSGPDALAALFDVVLAAGGEPRLRDEAAAAVDGATTIGTVPITVDLAGQVVGDPWRRACRGRRRAASLVVQAACLHSPDDRCSIVALSRRSRASSGSSGCPPRPRRATVEPARATRGRRRRVRAICSTTPVSARLAADANRLTSSRSSTPISSATPPRSRRCSIWHRRRGIGVVWIASMRGRRAAPGAVGARGRAVEPALVRRHRRRRRSTSRSSRCHPLCAERVAMALAPVRDVDARRRAGIARDGRVGRRARPRRDVERDRRAMVAAQSGGAELRVPIGVGADGPVDDRPRRGRPAHVDRRHHRVGQERVAAVDRDGDRSPILAAAGQLPVRRLQGRRGHEGVRTTPAHRRLRDQPRRRHRPACDRVAAGRARAPHGTARGARQGSSRTAWRSRPTRHRPRW